MADTLQARLELLTRTQYEDKKSRGEIVSNGLYLIKEITDTNPNVLTLCVGTGTQADLYDITDEVADIDFTDPANNYNIPAEYQIENKLWLVRQGLGDDTVYRVVMWWDGDPDTQQEGRFIDCFGEPNNLVVVNSLDGVTGVTNYAYIVRGGSQNTFWIYDGTEFQPIGAAVRPDNITIKFNTNDEIMGVGAFGMNATIGGTTYTAQAGSEIFNYVEGASTNNIATGNHSSASGISGIVTGDYSETHNVGNSNAVSLPPFADGRPISNRVPFDYGTGNRVYEGAKGFANTSFGVSNSTHSETNYCCFTVGAFNDIRYNSEFFTFIGYDNRMIDDAMTVHNNKFMSYFTIIGSGIRLYCGGNSSNVFAVAQGSNIIGNDISNCYLLGYGNYLGNEDFGGTWITEYMDNSYILGENNRIYNTGSSYSTPWTSSNKSKHCYAFGQDNNIADCTYTFLLGKNLYAYGENNTFMVGYNNPHGSVGLGGVLDPDGGTNDYVTDGIFVVANGVDSTTGDGLALVVRDEGVSPAYTSQTGHTYSGNFTAWDGTNLRTYRHTIPVESGTTPTFTYYPENTSEYVFASQIKTIYLSGAMNVMAYAHGSETSRYWKYNGETGYSVLSIVPEYSCVLMFRPTSDATLETLFVPVEDSSHNISSIYIMNPDFDLSTVSVVHAFIYRDGFDNMCVILSGYMEQPSA